jgi:hypothetical protein
MRYSLLTVNTVIEMILDICRTAQGARVLAGRGPARKVLGKLIAEAVNPAAPEIWMLDYLSADLVTGSFFSETFLAFTRHARTSLPNIYPIAGITEERSIHELEFLAESSGEVIPICSGMERGKLKAFRLIGSLDAHQEETLAIVTRLGQGTAKELFESATKTSAAIGITAWHNRLATLVRRGLLIEQSEGRQKTFRTLSKGV